MNIFKEYELRVLNLLAATVLSPHQIKILEQECELVSYEYTGCGYFLTVKHPSLPQTKFVCSKPAVIGRADGFDCGFVLFIEKGELMIECHTWGPTSIPEGFRNKDVQITTV